MSRRASSLDKTLVGIERDVGSEYDNVKIVAENIEAVKAASGHADTAIAQAAIATNAAISAATSESSAEEWANKPEDSLVSAIAGGDLIDDYSALHHANKASASASAAATSETNVINLEASTQSILDTINGTYLGVQAANPTLDLNGDPIDAGDWYFNSVDDVTRIYDGAIWHDTAIPREEFYDKIQADARFVNLAGSTMTGELKTPSIQLLGGTGTQGTFSWNSDENTVDLVQNGSILQLGQEIHYHVENQTGVTIPNGTAVMFTGSVGASGRGTVEPMVADGSITPQYFLGVTTEDLLNGGSGKVTHFGRVRGIDTSMYSEGDALWLDPIVPGGFTTTKPQSPNLKLLVAVVINSHAINGTIICRAGAGTDLHDDHRTEVLNPDAAGNPQVANSTWIWNDTLTRWENKTPAETKTALGYYTSSDRGVADGIASLDSGGKVPSAQLPSYVDDVLEYANLAAFPGSGETGKIYIAIDTGSTYRWTGTIYVEISQALAAADVKSLYESNANTNEFNDAEKTKLGTVETGATADQTDAEIKTAYENNADTNVFTDAEKTKLGTVESNAKDDQSAAEVPYTNTTSLLTATNVQAAVDEVEGRLDTAETKLAGIESGATADQTGAEIKLLYEAEANTNAFTDADHTKLDGIESGATADQTDLEIKTAYENNADTNAFTDSEKTKLGTVESNAKDDQNATEVPFTTTSDLVSSNVRDAIEEVYAAPAGINWTGNTRTTSFTAAASNGYLVSGVGIVVTMPASPEDGDVVEFIDYLGDWHLNSITVNGTIEGDSSLILDLEGDHVKLVYSSVTAQWEIAGGGTGFTRQVVDESFSSGLSVYTLTNTPLSKDTIEVYVGSVWQPPSSYTLVGNQITFSEIAPSAVHVRIR